MITADQIVLHLVGDYLLQSDWMAREKTKNHYAAAIHSLVYSVSFWFLHKSVATFAVIAVTHFLIDRYRLARYVVWAKNWPLTPPWGECKKTGYPPDRPEWMAVWLMIIADNVIHILINGLAIQYF